MAAENFKGHAFRRRNFAREKVGNRIREAGATENSLGRRSNGGTKESATKKPWLCRESAFLRLTSPQYTLCEKSGPKFPQTRRNIWFNNTKWPPSFQLREKPRNCSKKHLSGNSTSSSPLSHVNGLARLFCTSSMTTLNS